MLLFFPFGKNGSVRCDVTFLSRNTQGVLGVRLCWNFGGCLPVLVFMNWWKIGCSEDLWFNNYYPKYHRSRKYRCRNVTENCIRWRHQDGGVIDFRSYLGNGKSGCDEILVSDVGSEDYPSTPILNPSPWITVKFIKLNSAICKMAWRNFGDLSRDSNCAEILVSGVWSAVLSILQNGGLDRFCFAQKPHLAKFSTNSWKPGRFPDRPAASDFPAYTNLTIITASLLHGRNQNDIAHYQFHYICR